MIKRMIDFLGNLFHFWGHDYYGEKIDFHLAWELAKIYDRVPMDWDSTIVMDDGEQS